MLLCLSFLKMKDKEGLINHKRLFSPTARKNDALFDQSWFLMP